MFLLLLFFYLHPLSTSLSLAGNSGRLTRVIRHRNRKSSATHSYWCVQHLRVFNQWYGCQCLGVVNVCTGVDACDCTRELYEHRKRVCQSDVLPIQLLRSRYTIAVHRGGKNVFG